ncbi:Abi family protein [Bifidobacterium criceti]|uniref:DNA-binding protein n=1 Tax=Bifidobacterium criceti TaxID=1960969 RepID=A0A2A2EDX5_9BIFI|nr:Abi family protein [Bifidobacterium criceti]PAU67187.1 DNA-binding protein [Bifidobacterium criceti]
MHKPFTSIDDQISLLESRGVICDRDTETALMREGYYSVVNGYKNPFLDRDASAAAGDDRFMSGTRFEDILTLFDFDRRLRFAVFKALTLAEAVLRTVCAYCFSQDHLDEPNAYLNRENLFQPSSEQRDIVSGMLRTMEKIIDNGGRAPERGGKEYLHHCIASHDGEVPLWVLANDMSIGQVTTFYRIMSPAERGAVARQFEFLYTKSHRKPMAITSAKLDSIYSRIKNFRNICAHDERLYCARPFGLNNSLFQLMRDLQLVLTKKDHREFLQQVESLMLYIMKRLPGIAPQVFDSMGVGGFEDYCDYMESLRRI